MPIYIYVCVVQIQQNLTVMLGMLHSNSQKKHASENGFATFFFFKKKLFPNIFSVTSAHLVLQ